MAITRVGTTTTATDTGSSNFVTVTKPTGVASGDVLIAFLASNETDFTVPSGFSLVTESNPASTTEIFDAHCWVKVAGGSEPSNYTFTKTVAADGAPIVVTLTAWRGVDTADVIDAFSTTAGDASAEPANPSTSITQTGSGRLMFMRAARSTTAIPTFTNGSANWSEEADVGDFSGGSVRYAIGLYSHDVDTGAAVRTEPAITCSTTDNANAYILLALNSAVPPTNADAGAVAVTATAYNVSSLTSSSTSAFAAATATAYDITSQTGVAAEATTHAAATATAYDAMGWVIHPVDIGAIAFDATVQVTTNAEYASATASTVNQVGYFGAPARRTYIIPAEPRTLDVPYEDRTHGVS